MGVTKRLISILILSIIFSCSSTKALTPTEIKEVSTHKIIDYHISNATVIEKDRGDFDIIQYEGSDNIWITCWYYPKSNHLRATIRRDPNASFSFDKKNITVA